MAIFEREFLNHPRRNFVISSAVCGLMLAVGTVIWFYADAHSNSDLMILRQTKHGPVSVRRDEYLGFAWFSLLVLFLLPTWGAAIWPFYEKYGSKIEGWFQSTFPSIPMANNKITYFSTAMMACALSVASLASLIVKAIKVLE